MTFTTLLPRLNQLRKEHAVWQLLRSDNAPLTLAFIAEAFAEENEIAFNQARTLLETLLHDARQAELLPESSVDAASYLRQWIQARWLRELDNQLTCTDAGQVALRLAYSLEQRETQASASRLRIVQEAVRDLLVAISPDKSQRLALLEQQKAAIQREIDALQAGEVKELDPTEQREQLREVFQLAATLTNDFRRLEDEIRQMDQSLRVQMISEGATRGAVLRSLLAQENSLLSSDAGRAFAGFFQLLSDQDRSAEFRAQLRAILASPPAQQHLSTQEGRFLGQLIHELRRESQRILDVRRRTEESLRGFFDSKQYLEHRTIDRLLNQLEQTALQFKAHNISLKTETQISLPSGKLQFFSLSRLKLQHPNTQIDNQPVTVQSNEIMIDTETLHYLHSLRISDIAAEMYAVACQIGRSLTLAEFCQQRPLKSGLEELVACLRVCQAIDAARVEQREEQILVEDKTGGQLQASVPCYRFSADLFPKDLQSLDL